MKNKIRKKLQDYFLTGLVFILPFYLTFVFVKWVVTIIHNISAQLPINFFKSSALLRISLDILVVISALLVIVIAGYILSLYIGKKLNTILDKIVKNIPVVNSIYFAIKSLIDGLAVGSKKAFKEALYIEYPYKGSWVIGFLTGEAFVAGRKKYSVFVPTAPNPTSGFLLFVSKSQTRETFLTVEDAFKVIISGGIISPKKLKKIRK